MHNSTISIRFVPLLRARLIEEYKKRAAEAGKKGEGEGEGEGEVQMDIREKLKGMQVEHESLGPRV
eukprot:899317-Rhodomonas_salina.1